MMRLDHFVVHVDPDPNRLTALRKTIAPMGYPFEPTRGKRTQGFQAANIWIGQQYLEMVYLKRSDCRDWVPHWVDKYNRGLRGITCLFLLTDELDRVRNDLAERGLNPGRPERITFRFFFGLLKKTLPLRTVLVGPIPGTDLEIGFLELDSPRVAQYFKRYMVPNSRENGIDGICTAIIRHQFTDPAWRFLQSVFPQAEMDANRMFCSMDEGTTLIAERTQDASLQVELHASSSRPEYIGQSFWVENVRVSTTGKG